VTSQDKANWIRRIFTLGLIGAAAAAGLFFVMPKGWWKKGDDHKSGRKMTKEEFEQLQASPNKLTVVNMVEPGNRESEKLQGVLKDLKEKKYGDRVTMAELDVDEEPELAASQGVKKEKFAGQLNFYANGKKLDQLVAQTDPVVVEKTIDRLLAGLVQRTGKDWLPEVPGMERSNRGREVIPIQPKEPAKTPGKS
jgi:hypothetical protein